ncbi:MAG: glutathione S-transferase N-terminal domain-containing protein [Porticoccus sp.]|nr:glutathione S-transferase N-terminal domain-containing protein [Porticoccus sp.]
MQVIRWVLGSMILFFNWVFTPKSIKRDAELQAKIDQKTAGLSLYQYPACPFCVKVRRAIKRNSLNIQTVDAKRCETSKQELLEGGGKLKVPCLKIVDSTGGVSWMYESSDIINFLEQQVSELKAA